MGTLDKLKSLVGSKTPEQESMERQESMQREQLDIQKRVPSNETAQSMALMKQTGDNSYELGALALDPDADIEEFKSQLRGFRWVPVEQKDGSIKYVQDIFGKPALNEDGVNFIVNTVRFYASKTFSLTNYTGGDKREEGKRMIATRCKISAVAIAAALTLNRHEWKVDPVKRSLVNSMTQDFIEGCMSRSLDMKTANAFFGAQKTLTHIQQQVQPDGMQKTSNSWFK